MTFSQGSDLLHWMVTMFCTFTAGLTALNAPNQYSQVLAAGREDKIRMGKSPCPSRQSKALWHNGHQQTSNTQQGCRGPWLNQRHFVEVSLIEWWLSCHYYQQGNVLATTDFVTSKSPSPEITEIALPLAFNCWQTPSGAFCLWHLGIGGGLGPLLNWQPPTKLSRCSLQGLSTSPCSLVWPLQSCLFMLMHHPFPAIQL